MYCTFKNDSLNSWTRNKARWWQVLYDNWIWQNHTQCSSTKTM